MKTRTVLSAFLVLTAIFSCSMAGYIFGTTAAKEEISTKQLPPAKKESSPAPSKTAVVNNDTENIPAEQKEATVKDSVQSYVLREDNGKVALFIKNTDGTENLHSSYDVPIMFLPKNAREALQKGIEINSLDEIVIFVEEYVG